MGRVFYKSPGGCQEPQGGPPAKPDRSGAGTPLVLGVLIVALSGVAAWMIVPRLETVFLDYGFDLPGVTVAVLDGARWIRGKPGQTPPGWVFAAPVAVLLLSGLTIWGVLAARGSVTRTSTTLLSALLALVLVGGIVVFLLAIGIAFAGAGMSFAS